MSPAVEDFLYQSASKQRSNFQNPNPSVLKFSTDSGKFNNNNSSNLNTFYFDCSNDAATMAAARPSRRKHVKVKKHLNNGSVITKPANCTVNGADFVFNSSNNVSVLNSSLGQTTSSENGEKESPSELLDSNMLRFSIGATDNSKLGNKLGSEQVQDSGNKFQCVDLNEIGETGNGSETGDNKFEKFNGVDFVFGAKMSNGGMNKNASNFKHGCGPDTEIGETMGRSGVDGFVKVNKFTSEVESRLVDSISGLNLGTRGQGEGNSLDDNVKREESDNFNSGKPKNVDFVFSANYRDIQRDLHHQKDEFKEKIVKLAPDETATEDLGKKDHSASNTEFKSGFNMFSNSKVNQVFHVGSQTENAPSFKGRKKLNNEMSNLKSKGAKQDNTIDSFRDGSSHFVFKSNLGNVSGDNAQSKVSTETKTTNIPDPTKETNTNKINHSDGDACSSSSNLFVFGSDKRNISCGEKGKSDQPKTEAKSIKETAASSSSSSTTGLGFVPKVDYCNAPLTNGPGITINFSYSSKVGEFEDSFTGFNTPDINLANSFTVDMFPFFGKKLEFSKTNSVGLRKIKKTKAKLRQQGKNRQKGGLTSLSKEVPSSFEEPSGCSPMDVSPCGVANCDPTTMDPATSQILKNEDDVDTTENLGVKSFSSSSGTLFADGNVSARQRPRQKKYKLKTGCVSESINYKSGASASYEHANGGHAEVSNQDECEKWRKRGNQAYKNGNLSEAEVCYSMGISSIPNTETPGFCLEPLLLCYSNRAAARMALGRLREGLKDCRMAASLDPDFVKANLRSANCHLLLGELEDASYYYNKCLESTLILDRRIAIEAADGLQNAQKVAEYLKLSSDLLAQKTYESSTNALEIIVDALAISCYSENLLKMKGDTFLVLGKHKEVVQLCEQTLDLAEKNFENGTNTTIKLWRWNMLSKSHFYLGRLEIALDYIERHERLRPTIDKDRTVGSEESLAHLAITIRELLHCKNAGNEAFQSGKHMEAVEHYTTAISKSIESLPFAAVCFSNRAAAHQSLGEIIDAIGDCSIAIALDGTYSKALSRRATLWEMIRDYKHAADDLQRLVTILEVQLGENSQKSATPGRTTNSSAKDLRKARRRISSIEEKAKKERSLDFYLILGIKPSDAAAEVKKAYRKAALRHHPDKAGQVIARTESGSNGQQWKAITESIQIDADSLFKMIGEAYAVLSDSTKRSKYDLEEEMWDDTNINVCSSSSRRSSDFYSSPFETSNRRNSHDTRKTYSNSYYHYWEDSRKSYHGSYPRW
ncbi:uncharacterized protein [Rutidosis leptorrhynchoides]|uniref:uncharacterized protein n=1 Tax=Rutidosis leptorrhynchoides TaxID=125765 RepID=UPI003A99F1A5